MKRKSWMLGVLFVLIALVSYMAKPEKEQIWLSRRRSKMIYS